MIRYRIIIPALTMSMAVLLSSCSVESKNDSITMNANIEKETSTEISTEVESTIKESITEETAVKDTTAEETITESETVEESTTEIISDDECQNDILMMAKDDFRKMIAGLDCSERDYYIREENNHSLSGDDIEENVIDIDENGFVIQIVNSNNTTTKYNYSYDDNHLFSEVCAYGIDTKTGEEALLERVGFHRDENNTERYLEEGKYGFIDVNVIYTDGLYDEKATFLDSVSCHDVITKDEQGRIVKKMSYNSSSYHYDSYYNYDTDNHYWEMIYTEEGEMDEINPDYLSDVIEHYSENDMIIKSIYYDVDSFKKNEFIVIKENNYEYDDKGNLVTFTSNRSDEAEISEYKYDDKDRLISEITTRNDYYDRRYYYYPEGPAGFDKKITLSKLHNTSSSDITDAYVFANEEIKIIDAAHDVIFTYHVGMDVSDFDI